MRWWVDGRYDPQFLPGPPSQKVPLPLSWIVEAGDPNEAEAIFRVMVAEKGLQEAGLTSVQVIQIL